MSEASSELFGNSEGLGDAAEPSGNSGELPPVARLLPERHPNDDRTCIRCLGPIGRKAYFDLDFVCGPCDADWERYPWRSTHGGMTP